MFLWCTYCVLTIWCCRCWILLQKQKINCILFKCIELYWAKLNFRRWTNVSVWLQQPCAPIKCYYYLNNEILYLTHNNRTCECWSKGAKLKWKHTLILEHLPLNQVFEQPDVTAVVPPGCHYKRFWLSATALPSPVTHPSPQPWNNKNNSDSNDFAMAPWHLHTQLPPHFTLTGRPRSWDPWDSQRQDGSLYSGGGGGSSRIQELSASSWCRV